MKLFVNVHYSRQAEVRMESLSRLELGGTIFNARVKGSFGDSAAELELTVIQSQYQNDTESSKQTSSDQLSGLN